MSWKNTGLILAGMALVGTAAQMYKQDFMKKPHNQIQQVVQTKEPVKVYFPDVTSIFDALQDTDYQVLARVVLSETDARGSSYQKVAEVTWNRYLETREEGESLAEFVYHQPNVFKAIHKRSVHWEPNQHYDEQTIYDVLSITYNETLREESTGPDHFDHIKVSCALTTADVEQYANEGIGHPVLVHDWMKKGTIKVYPHDISGHLEKIVLITSDNYN